MYQCPDLGMKRRETSQFSTPFAKLSAIKFYFGFGLVSPRESSIPELNIDCGDTVVLNALLSETEFNLNDQVPYHWSRYNNLIQSCYEQTADLSQFLTSLAKLSSIKLYFVFGLAFSRVSYSPS